MAKAVLVYFLNKHDQALVVRAMIQIMSTNTAAEQRAEEYHRATDMYIASVTLPDGSLVTTHVGILEAFRLHFQDLSTRDPGLSSARFGAYLVEFPCLEVTEAAGCEGLITEDEVWKTRKQISRDKVPASMVILTKCT